MEEAAGSGGFNRTNLWSRLELLQLGRDVVEFGVKSGTDIVDCGDDHDRNTSGDQAVFNRGRSGLVFQECVNL